MSKNNRIWEIDLLRTVAIILMIIFHTVVDLKDYYGYNIEYLRGFWYYEGKLSAIIFIFVSGISSTFSRNNLKRGLRVFMWGMVLTGVTYFYNKEYYIKFGILHFLGISMMLYHFVNTSIKEYYFRYFFIFATLCIVIGNIFSYVTIRLPYLFAIGLTHREFSSMDYYPLLPWFGLFLYGALTGKKIYEEPKSFFHTTYNCPIVSYISRHSLFIYLIHQPIILFILYIIHSSINY